MTANATFWVDCTVTTPSGNKRSEMVSVASPDLVDTKEAHRRARKTGEARLLTKLRREYGESGHLVQVRATGSRCVG